jgi:hypothetical protein
MKNRSLKYLLLIICIGLFSTNLFAQIPAYPGGDPMEPDSAKNVVSLKPVENKQLTSQSNILLSKKDKDFNDKTTEKVELNKKEEEDTQISSK